MADGQGDQSSVTPEMMVARTKKFANRVAKLCQALPEYSEAMNIRRQLNRSANSVAANYRAAQRARSKAEFRAKLGVVEEEADESCHWLEAVIEQEHLSSNQVAPLLDEARQLTAVIVTAIKSSRSVGKEQPAESASPSAIRHPPSATSKIGHGFDLHRLEDGLALVVCGEKLPHDRGCAAHSDGDVVYHAVTDAVFGALGQDDIGQLFPDTDPKWKDADSAVFLREAVRRMREAGYALGNLDATVILQAPKLSPHKEKMKRNLAEMLGVDPKQVNLKGKTHEKVDALGENRAIACHAVVLLVPAGG